MDAPRLTDSEAEVLIEELAAALEAMVDHTCDDMGPLWLEATREARQNLEDHGLADLGFAPSPRYVALSKGARSRYRSLAAWRHAVLWQPVRVSDRDYRAAMETVYFSFYPDNAPPYAWSSRASEAPGVERWPSPTTLKHQAKEGCCDALAQLRSIERRLKDEGSWATELRALLLKPATRDSLRDVLKLEEHLTETR